MSTDTPGALGALHVDEGKLRCPVDEVVRSSVDETLNGLLVKLWGGAYVVVNGFVFAGGQ